MQLGDGAAIVAANTGDHPLILDFLIAARQTQLAEDFQSRLDQPGYRPSDRLLVRRGGQLAAHVQLSSQISWYAGQRMPTVVLVDFESLPEYRDSDYEDRLLETAEDVARQEGAAVALVRTTRHDWFAARGWSRRRGQGHTRANPRAILSSFDGGMLTHRRRTNPSLEVRAWRHFELDAIEDVYQQVAARMWGPQQRSETWWQWLVGRKAGEQILMAVDPRITPPANAAASDDPASRDPRPAAPIGYAVLRDSCIVEMFTLPGRQRARLLLLARACREALDRGHHTVSLLTPPDDPLHEVMVTAGGQWIRHDASRDGIWMFKLLAPEKWVTKLYPVLHQRSLEGQVPRPFECSFALPEGNVQFMLTRRSARLEKRGKGQTDVRCDKRMLDQLLASNIRPGEIDLPESIAGAVHQLFPLEFFWRSTFEWLRL